MRPSIQLLVSWWTSTFACPCGRCHFRRCHWIGVLGLLQYELCEHCSVELFLLPPHRPLLCSFWKTKLSIDTKRVPFSFVLAVPDVRSDSFFGQDNRRSVGTNTILRNVFVWIGWLIGFLFDFSWSGLLASILSRRKIIADHTNNKGESRIENHFALRLPLRPQWKEGYIFRGNT